MRLRFAPAAAWQALPCVEDASEAVAHRSAVSHYLPVLILPFWILPGLQKRAGANADFRRQVLVVPDSNSDPCPVCLSSDYFPVWYPPCNLPKLAVARGAGS
jgi:hypothetical protein